MNTIHGITLEQYADLGAEIAGHEQDMEAQKRLVAARGVDPNLWPAVVAGWTDRMRDVSDMGQTATRYMALYQAALTRKRGALDVSFEDFVALSAAAKAWGLPRMLATYGLDQAAWTQIAGAWTGQRIPQAPHAYGSYGIAVEQEAARLAQGGAHRPVSLLKQAGAGAGPGMGAGAGAGAGAGFSVEAQMARNMAQANVAQAMASAQAQSANAYAQAADNLGFFGRFWAKLFGFGSIADGIGPGMQAWVVVNGQKVPCMVGQIGNGQAAVTLASGQQVTVAMGALSRS